MSNGPIKFKAPSIKRDDFVSVLDALVGRKIFPGEIHDRMVGVLSEHFGTDQLLLLSSRWIGVKIMSGYLRNRKKDPVSSVFMPDTVSPFYVELLTTEGFECIPVDVDADMLPQFDPSRFKPGAALFMEYPLGLPIDLSGYASLDMTLVADCTGSFNALNKGKQVGKGFDFLIFSFRNEDVITAGDGACIVVKEKKCWEELKAVTEEYNLTMSDFNASLFLSQYGNIDRMIKSRRLIWDKYMSAGNWPMPPAARLNENEAAAPPPNYSTPNYSSFPLFVEDMQHVLKLAAQLDIEVRPIVGKPVSLLKGIAERMPGSERYSRNGLFIPLYPTLTERDVERVITLLRKVQ